jgi:hypothetical protein
MVQYFSFGKVNEDFDMYQMGQQSKKFSVVYHFDLFLYVLVTPLYTNT